MTGSGVRFDMIALHGVPWSDVRDDVRYLETLDIGTLWLGDKYEIPPRWGVDGPFLEAWSTLGALAACTTRVRIGTLVSDALLRHPAMLAKQAATVDCISGGRLDLGIGAGDGEREQTAWLGLSPLTPGQRVDRLREAVEVIDRLLRDQRLSYDGEYYHLVEAPLSPAPMQRPRPPLTIAAVGKRALRVVAERADVWVSHPSGDSSEEKLKGFRECGRLLDESCSAIKRDPRTVERACLVWSDSDTPFASADAFQDYVGRYREAGVQRFIFCYGSAAAPAPFIARMTAGMWASRDSLDAFAAQAMADLQGASDTPSLERFRGG